MFFFYLVALIVLILDQGTKLIIQQGFSLYQTKHIIHGILAFTYVLNPGAAFGILRYQTGLLILLTLVVIGALFFYRKEIPHQNMFLRWGLSLGLGGALGNLIDRLRLKGNVVDFIDLHVWPVFNIADIAIVVGVGMILWGTLRKEWLRKHRRGVE